MEGRPEPEREEPETEQGGEHRPSVIDSLKRTVPPYATEKKLKQHNTER